MKDRKDKPVEIGILPAPVAIALMSAGYPKAEAMRRALEFSGKWGSQAANMETFPRLLDEIELMLRRRA